MKNLKWRLSKLFTPSELTELVANKIITQEEAKEILFTVETDEERNIDSFKEEIKFLRGLIEELSKNNRTVVKEYIHTYQSPIKPAIWYQPYQWWSNGTICTSGAISYTTAGTTGTSSSLLTTSEPFTNISTF